MKSRSTIERDVANVRKRFGIESLPVDVQEVAKKMGIKLTPQELEEKVSGALFAQDGQAVIAVNSRHSHRRQRFTVAHELAHYVLHWKGGDKATAFVDGALSFRRDEQSKDGSLTIEKEANSFAAELLMPRVEVESLIRTRHLDLHDEKAIRKMSAIFDVSEQALTVRLISLGLLETGT